MALIFGIAALLALSASVFHLLLLPFAPGRRLHRLGRSGGFLLTATTCAMLAHGFHMAALEERAGKIEPGSLDECRVAVNCWLDKTWRTATFHCPAVIERFATHGFEWTDELLEPKFNRYREKNPQGVEVTMIGDKIRFQNGGGTWSRMTYECDVLPDTDIIVDVRVETTD